MGGAYAALSTDASGVFWNPGALSQAPGTQLIAMHGAYLQGLNYEFLSVSKERITGQSTGGFGLFFLNAGGIPITHLQDTTLPPGDDNLPVLEGTTSYRAFQSLFALAWPGGLGFTLKALFQQADTVSGYGVGLDIGYFKNISSSLQVGVNIKDITTTPLFWSTGTHEFIYPQVDMGMAVRPGNWLVMSGDAVARFDSRPERSEAFVMGFFSIEPRFGAELLMGPARFRAGIQSGVATVGAGFYTSKLSADYALLSHPDLGAAHRFSLCIRFGM